MDFKINRPLRYVMGIPVAGDSRWGLTWLEKKVRDMPEDVRDVFGHNSDEGIKPIVPAQVRIYDLLVRCDVDEGVASKAAISFPNPYIFEDDGFNVASDFVGGVVISQKPLKVLLSIAEKHRKYAGDREHYDSRLENLRKFVNSKDSDYTEVKAKRF